jgi:vacuolar-type H+-ATPase subunit I/STV1
MFAAGSCRALIRQMTLSKQVRISPFIRVLSGVIGILGFAAIAFNTMQDDGPKPGLMLLASFFAGFIFLFVALFGKYPWDRTERDE